MIDFKRRWVAVGGFVDTRIRNSELEFSHPSMGERVIRSNRNRKSTSRALMKALRNIEEHLTTEAAEERRGTPEISHGLNR